MLGAALYNALGRGGWGFLFSVSCCTAVLLCSGTLGCFVRLLYYQGRGEWVVRVCTLVLFALSAVGARGWSVRYCCVGWILWMLMCVRL